MLAIAYIGVSAIAVGADLILLLIVKSEPYKALRGFFYWNVFHFGVDLTIILTFFIAVLTK
ncbi:hypothetical protein MTO96_044580, partial [Rhipicephalus appendiculatus]